MITLHYFGNGSVQSHNSPELTETEATARLDTVVVKQHCCGASEQTVFNGKVAPKSM